MPTPLYDDVLTRESEARLSQLLRDLPHPVSLAGGHAVRRIVQDRWQARFGEDYFGSRDIDVCYFVDPAWTEQTFKMSAAGQASLRIREIGYRPMGVFRFGLWMDGHGNVIDREPASPRMLGVDYHILAIDPMVTHIHSLSKKILGFHPIDEPLLASVFDDPRLRETIEELGPNVYVPTAPMLVATKLKSLPDRDKHDKAVKDLCDLYALAAYGGVRTEEIRRIAHYLLSDVPHRVDIAMRHGSLETAVEHLDISRADFRAVVGPLAAQL